VVFAAARIVTAGRTEKLGRSEAEPFSPLLGDVSDPLAACEWSFFLPAWPSGALFATSIVRKKRYNGVNVPLSKRLVRRIGFVSRYRTN